jgi:hypothetical protein
MLLAFSNMPLNNCFSFDLLVYFTPISVLFSQNNLFYDLDNGIYIVLQ